MTINFSVRQIQFLFFFFFKFVHTHKIPLMKFKFTFLIVFSLLIFNHSNAFNPFSHNRSNALADGVVKSGDPNSEKVKSLLELSPKEYRKLTGKKLSFGQSIKMKLAQKILKLKMKKSDGDYSTPVYVICSIFFLGWLLMGLQDNWKGNNWWISLLLYLIAWLPGVIFALIKMKDYVND